MARVLMKVFWPSFLVAIVAEGLFFSVFDPEHLVASEGAHELPPLAVYTLGFFFFWSCGALASALSFYLARPDGK